MDMCVFDYATVRRFLLLEEEEKIKLLIDTRKNDKLVLIILLCIKYQDRNNAFKKNIYGSTKKIRLSSICSIHFYLQKIINIK